ncbi:glycoside hydrolase family protein [Microbulbifer sp. ZKSA006]|uniref:glycoside hydrolase family protein n=1 Tax=Microbulbifer sp. ZKSA006 TaxID=3243390 RepID=UPI00403A2C54
MKKIARLIALHEGFREKPYRCTAGKLTVAFGRNLDDVGLSREEGEILLANDIEVSLAILQDRVDGFDCLSQVRQAVLVDMCFNLGWPRLSGFKRFLAAVEDGDYSEAAKEMLDSKWARQVGRRARRLADMMLSNVWAREVQT